MAHTSSHGTGAQGGTKLNHETTDISLAGTTRAAIVTLVVIGVVMAIVYGARIFFQRQARAMDRPAPALAERDFGRRLPPVPRIQSRPVDDLTTYRAAQLGKLESYGWVDRTAGVVRLPIERAMALTAERAATIADPQAAAIPAPPAAPAAPTTPAAPATPPAAAASGH